MERSEATKRTGQCPRCYSLKGSAIPLTNRVVNFVYACGSLVRAALVGSGPSTNLKYGTRDGNGTAAEGKGTGGYFTIVGHSVRLFKGPPQPNFAAKSSSAWNSPRLGLLAGITMTFLCESDMAQAICHLLVIDEPRGVSRSPM